MDIAAGTVTLCKWALPATDSVNVTAIFVLHGSFFSFSQQCAVQAQSLRACSSGLMSAMAVLFLLPTITVVR